MTNRRRQVSAKRPRPRTAARILSGNVTLGALLAILLLVTLSTASASDKPNVVVLGIDGMDPVLLEKFIAKGRMPNFKRFIETGSFSTLKTSIPPQSPVAWSNFITGMDPGGHGIFDFIHQDRSNYMPDFSAALVEAPARTFRFGDWVIPLSKGKVENLRQGAAFWQLLDKKDVPYLVFRIPANFPPVESNGINVAGMGTPDLRGTYGTFSFYTDDPTLMTLDVSGGEIYPVQLSGDKIEAAFIGPENSLRADKPSLIEPFTVYVDRDNGAVKIVVGDETIILQEQEWSDWIEVKFDVLGPFNRISGITRLYLKSVTPYFQLYATPININPADPALPIASAAKYSRRMYEKIGFHYTQGMPEDTKALEWGIFSDREFLHQARLVFEERLDMLDVVLDEYDGGFLFFYFSSIDQVCHMQWRNMDPDHPGHTPEGAQYKDAIENLYARMDSVFGVVQTRLPENTTLVVMSDHGFAPYYQKFNLNTWLYENGFMELRRPDDIGQFPLFSNVFWRRTRAFGLGINSLYVNLRGREAQGVVREGEDYEALIAEITEKLLAYRDPITGAQVIERVYRTSEVFEGEMLDRAPDIVVGYAAGYRCSDDSALGRLSKMILSDNLDKWSGDHCMAFEAVPGVLLCNRPLKKDDPSLTDLSATILGLYGVDKPAVMKGRVLFDAGHVGDLGATPGR